MSGIELPSGDMKKSVYDIDIDGIVDNSEKLEGSTKTEVQDHTPKAHTLASHSTKAHNELTDVGVNDHHNRLHAMDDVLDHSGIITDAQHGTKTTIPNAHHTPPTITQTKSLAIGNNTPQNKSVTQTLLPTTYLLNQNINATTEYVDIDCASAVGADADAIFLNMRLYANSGSGIGAFLVMPKTGTAPTEHILYGNTTLPMYTLCPYIRLSGGSGQPKLFQWRFVANGVISATIQLSVMGYTERVVAHNHTVTPEPHDHNI